MLINFFVNIFFFYRKIINYKKNENKFIINNINLWNLNNGITINITKEVKKILNKKNYIKLKNKYKNYIIEIQYKYKGNNYRILYQKEIFFPPYTHENETPSIKILKKDFKEINIIFKNLNNNKINFNLNNLLLELRGPGEILFHQNVLFCCNWNLICKWIKLYYIKNSNIIIFENDIIINILWTNNEQEVF